ncbi:head-tail connector protein [Sphingomonas sp. MG17]|uniref:Head-tail connector protein n=1 Tax=Sphingomonas tagetis TaxID=2949092 RepID=A0A9X2HL63_9SPHN|nr:head-tail connector protein [Sphingomonas tagetis]MCP3729258.1 head-tail connector protein [Sphingomonas tagetis]
MSEILTLDTIKAHLVLDADDESEDLRLRALATAAVRSIELRTNRFVDPNDAPDDHAGAEFDERELAMVEQAALLLIGDWYANRENSVAGAMTELPTGLDWLIEPLRDFSGR